MIFGEILFYVLIFLVVVGSILLLTKGKLKLPTFYKIRVVVLNPGCNIHADIKPKSLPFKVKVKNEVESGIEEKEYTVTLEKLWKVKESFIKRPYNFLMGIKGRYLILFRSNEEGEPIKNIETKATPILIRNVKNSRILKMALNEVFSKGMGGFGKFILIFGGALLALYLAAQQGLIG